VTLILNPFPSSSFSNDFARFSDGLTKLTAARKSENSPYDFPWGVGVNFLAIQNLGRIPKSYHKINTGPFLKTPYGLSFVRQAEIERIHGVTLQTRHYATAVPILGQSVQNASLPPGLSAACTSSHVEQSRFRSTEFLMSCRFWPWIRRGQNSQLSTLPIVIVPIPRSPLEPFLDGCFPLAAVTFGRVAHPFRPGMLSSGLHCSTPSDGFPRHFVSRARPSAPCERDDFSKRKLEGLYGNQHTRKNVPAENRRAIQGADGAIVARR
jgi:hypothetical protein